MTAVQEKGMEISEVLLCHTHLRFPITYDNVGTATPKPTAFFFLIRNLGSTESNFPRSQHAESGSLVLGFVLSQR
jgi:hypothetical protein